jgi:hypothetical protein
MRFIFYLFIFLPGELCTTARTQITADVAVFSNQILYFRELKKIALQ